MSSTHPPVQQIITDDYLHDLYLTQEDGVTPLPITAQTFSLTIMDKWGGSPLALPTGLNVSIEDGPGGHLRIYIPTADMATLAGVDEEVIFRLKWDDIGTTILWWSVRMTA